MAPTLRDLATQYPVVMVTGPRQSGKTTLCRQVFADKPYVNLELPDVRQYAIDDPRALLAEYCEGAVFDEIQRAPDLLSYIQGMVDENGRAGRFVLTGSQQFAMMESVTQSLAGRIGLLKLLPFSLEEMGETESSVDRLLFRGGYPRIIAQSLLPTQVMGDYVETYVQRDIRQLIQLKNVSQFETFVRLCAGRCGQLLNLSALGADAGVSHTTAREWISLLEAGYIVFRLRPWHANIAKRMVKAPKLYFYDTALAAYLLGIEEEGHIRTHPLRGALFENAVVVECMKYRLNRGKRCDFFFYRDQAGHEVDLLLPKGGGLFPVEIKSGATVNRDFFKGLDYFSRLAGVEVDTGAVVYGGDVAQPRSRWKVYPLRQVAALLA